MTIRISSTPPVGIDEEWDRIAETRDRQIRTGIDKSYDEILLPYIRERVKRFSPETLLDVGCGSGRLTANLSELSGSCLGIDPSAASIELARKIGGEECQFERHSVASYAAAHPTRRFDVIVANMVLMDVVNLDETVRHMSTLLAHGGRFITTFCHPCFWPRYRTFENHPDFHYSRELFITEPFRIASETTEFSTTHVHRPLTQYFDVFAKNRMQLLELSELPVSPFPRFVCMTLSRF